MGDSHGPEDYFRRNQQPLNNPQPEDFMLARLFMGSPEATEISHLQRSLERIIHNESIGKSGEVGQVREPSLLEKRDVFTPFEDELRLTVQEMRKSGAVFGDGDISSVVVLDRQLIFNPDKPNWPLLSIVAEVRDRSANNFVMSSHGLHQVDGPGFIRLSGHPDQAAEFDFEVLITEEAFIRQSKELEEIARGVRMGDPAKVYLGSLLADTIRQETAHQHFSFADVSSVQKIDRNQKQELQYDMKMNVGEVISISIRYQSSLAMPVAAILSPGDRRP
jgi:hypothetical protein